MISKFKIARKECVETEAWLKLLYLNGSIDEANFKKHRNLCGRIQRMLTSSCITIEKKIEQNKGAVALRKNCTNYLAFPDG